MFKTFDKKFFFSSLKLFFPIILAGIIQASVSFIDNIVVSSSTVHDGSGIGMDKIDLKVVGAGNEIFFLISSFGMAFTILFGVLYSQFAKREREFAETFKLSVWIVTTTTIVTSLISFLFAKDLINLFFHINEGNDKALVVEHGTNFIKIISIGNIFYCLAINLLNPMTIKGKVKYGLYLALTSLVVNFSLDMIFVHVFKWGAEGSAWATVIAYFSEFIFVLFLFIKNKKFFKNWTHLVALDKKIFKEIGKRIMLFLFFVIMQSSFAISTILWTSLYGSDYLAGITTGYIVENVMFVSFTATTKGISIFVGPLLGHGKMKEAKEMSKKLFWPNMFICLMSMTFAGALTTFFPKLMLNNPTDVWNAQWLIITFIVALPAYMGVSYFSSMFEVGGMQFIPNFWNRGFIMWAQLPLIVILSPIAIDLDWRWAFFIDTVIMYIPFIVIYWQYRRFKWLRKIDAK